MCNHGPSKGLIKYVLKIILVEFIAYNITAHTEKKQWRRLAMIVARAPGTDSTR